LTLTARVRRNEDNPPTYWEYVQRISLSIQRKLEVEKKNRILLAGMRNCQLSEKHTSSVSSVGVRTACPICVESEVLLRLTLLLFCKKKQCKTATHYRARHFSIITGQVLRQQVTVILICNRQSGREHTGPEVRTGDN